MAACVEKVMSKIVSPDMRLHVDPAAFRGCAKCRGRVAAAPAGFPVEGVLAEGLVGVDADVNVEGPPQHGAQCM